MAQDTPEISDWGRAGLLLVIVVNVAIWWGGARFHTAAKVCGSIVTTLPLLWITALVDNKKCAAKRKQDETIRREKEEERRRRLKAMSAEERAKLQVIWTCPRCKRHDPPVRHKLKYRNEDHDLIESHDDRCSHCSYGHMGFEYVLPEDPYDPLGPKRSSQYVSTKPGVYAPDGRGGVDRVKDTRLL